MNSKLSHLWPPILVAALFLGAWQLLVVIQDLKPFLLRFSFALLLPSVAAKAHDSFDR